MEREKICKETERITKKKKNVGGKKGIKIKESREKLSEQLGEERKTKKETRKKADKRERKK